MKKHINIDKSFLMNLSNVDPRIRVVICNRNYSMDEIQHTQDVHVFLDVCDSSIHTSSAKIKIKIQQLPGKFYIGSTQCEIYCNVQRKSFINRSILTSFNTLLPPSRRPKKKKKKKQVRKNRMVLDKIIIVKKKR